MKSILHIITGLNDGGAEAVLYRLCTHDRADRHHVISLMDGGKYGPLLAEQGVAVTCLDMPRGRVTWQGVWRLGRTIRQVRPDAVQTWMYHADLLGGAIARLAGQGNVIWGVHHTTFDAATSPRSTIMVARLCARLSRLVPRRIVCCAEKTREVHAGLGYDPARMRVIPNGYDLSVFQPDPAAGAAVRAELNIRSTQAMIGFVARFHPQKDHGNLLQALALLKERGVAPTCLLIGAGMELDNAALATMIAERGLTDQVHLLGRRSDIPAVMSALDLHVMASAFGEAFPNVLAEAMACGTPCVSTDVGDAGEIVGETGWVVPPRDPAALADAIAVALSLRAASDWADRQAAARAHIQSNYTVGWMVERYRAAWSLT